MYMYTPLVLFTRCVYKLSVRLGERTTVLPVVMAVHSPSAMNSRFASDWRETPIARIWNALQQPFDHSNHSKTSTPKLSGLELNWTSSVGNFEPQRLSILWLFRWLPSSRINWKECLTFAFNRNSREKESEKAISRATFVHRNTTANVMVSAVTIVNEPAVCLYMSVATGS